MRSRRTIRGHDKGRGTFRIRVVRATLFTEAVKRKTNLVPAGWKDLEAAYSKSPLKLLSLEECAPVSISNTR